MAHDSQLGDFADDVHALLEELNYAPATVIGFSFGGMVAQELALRHPADVLALVLSATCSTFSDELKAAQRILVLLVGVGRSFRRVC